jgi:hypothetical protein
MERLSSVSILQLSVVHDINLLFKRDLVSDCGSPLSISAVNSNINKSNFKEVNYKGKLIVVAF